MINVNNICKQFGSLQVLDHVSFQVKPGQVTGIVGPNGCGKSTMIKSILGLVIPDSGDIIVKDNKVSKSSQYRHDLGYMPQNPDFPANLKVNELFDLLEDVRGEKASFRKELTDLFNLHDSINKNLGILSGGTKQKVAAVAAFMFDPDLLILDEPTVGLDPVSSLRFKELVQDRAKKGKAILLVSHIMSEMEQMVDQMIFMLDGKVNFQGSIEELKANSGSMQNLESAVVKLLNTKEQ